MSYYFKTSEGLIDANPLVIVAFLAFYIRNQTNTSAFSSNCFQSFADSSHSFLPSISS
jgi:hypothetical protein